MHRTTWLLIGAVAFVLLMIATTARSEPVLLYTDMQKSFDAWQTQAASDPATMQAFMARYHRAQVYSPFADRTLNPFGKERGLEYEAGVGVKDTWTEWPILEPHVLRDGEGNLLYFDYACNGTTCTQYADDITSSALREIKINRLHQSADKGYRGFWIDNINFPKPSGKLPISNGANQVRPINPTTGLEMTNDQWSEGLATYIEEIRSTFPEKEIACNSIWYAVWTIYTYRQHKACDYINMEGGLLDGRGKEGYGIYDWETRLLYIDKVHAIGPRIIFDTKGSGTGQPLSNDDFLFALATYWLVREDGDLLGIDDPSRVSPGSLDERLTLDLGEPLGPRRLENEIYIRNFTRGYVIMNPTNRTIGTLAAWGVAIFVSPPATAQTFDMVKPSTARYSCQGSDGTIISENHISENVAVENCTNAAANAPGAQFNVYFGTTLLWKITATGGAVRPPAAIGDLQQLKDIIPSWIPPYLDAVILAAAKGFGALPDWVDGDDQADVIEKDGSTYVCLTDGGPQGYTWALKFEDSRMVSSVPEIDWTTYVPETLPHEDYQVCFADLCSDFYKNCSTEI